MPKTVERGQHFGIKYEILFAGGSWRDITSHVDSRQTKVTLLGCTADLKGGISTMTVELRYGGTKTARASHSSLVGQLLQAKADLETVHFRASGLIEFVGKIDLSGFSQTNSIIPGFVTATVEDMSYLLDEKMTTFEYPTGTDLEETGWAVFDPLNPNISIVTQRLLAAGYKLTDIDTEASDTIGERVRRAVGGDDDRTYRDFLNILLYEYCAVLYCDGRGKFVVRRLYQSAPVAGREVTEFLATDGIQTKGTDYQFDGEQVVWSTLATRNNPVYVANISVDYDQSGPIKGDEVLPEDYWPTDGDIEETWQEFDASFLDRPYLTKESRKKNKDLSIISVKNLKAETHFDVPADFLLANNPPTIEPRRARFLYYNQNKTETRNVYGFQLSGDVLYRQKLNETTYPADSKKTADKFETEFVFDALAAERLANHLFRFRKNGDIAHVWSEIRSAVPPLFEVVNVAAPDTLISTLGMVLSQDITIPAPNKVRTTFTSVSITAFNSEPARTRSVVLGSPAVEPGRDGTSGDKAVVQYALGTADAPYSDASVLLGTADTLVGTDLALVGVDKSNTWQSSPPTPAEGEYVWRREGWYTPPALWPSLWNVTRLTGSDGKDAEKIELTKSPENVVVSARGWMKQRYITIQAVLHNIDGTITWSCSDGTLTPVELEPGVVDNTRVVLDGATMTGTSATVIATVTFEGTIYTAPLSIDRIITGDTKAYNFGGFGGTYEADGALNPVELPDGDLLTKGDYFMWVHDTVNKDHATNERLKGEIYEYTGSEWMRSTNGDLVMTMFDTFAELANDVDSSVIGNAVIKNLVAIKAFIEQLKVNKLEVITEGLNFTVDPKGYKDNGQEYALIRITNADSKELLAIDGLNQSLLLNPDGGVWRGGVELYSGDTTVLSTQMAEGGSTVSSSPSASLYSVAQLISGSGVQTSGSAPGAIGGSYGGEAIAKGLVHTSNKVLTFGSKSDSLKSYDQQTKTYTLPVNLGAEVVKVSVSINHSGSTMKRNGSALAISGGGGSFTFPYVAGDVYSITTMSYESTTAVLKYQYDMETYEARMDPFGSLSWSFLSSSSTGWGPYQGGNQSLPTPTHDGQTATIRTNRQSEWFNETTTEQGSISYTMNFETSSAKPSGITLITSAGNYKNIPYTSGYLKESDYPITLGDWSSASNKAFISGTDFLTSFSGLGIGVSYIASPSASNLTNYQPAGGDNAPLSGISKVGRTANSIEFSGLAGRRTVVKFGGNGTTAGVYAKLSGSVALSVKAAGVKVASLSPATASETVGVEGAPFYAGYYKYLDVAEHLNNIKIVSPSSTATLEITGSVKANQSLSTADDVAFATVNTGYGANKVTKVSFDEDENVYVSGWNTVTYALPSMQLHEIKIVSFLGGVSSDRGTWYLKTPSGGSYVYVFGYDRKVEQIRADDVLSDIRAGRAGGGTNIMTERGSNDDSQYFCIRGIIMKVAT